MNRALYLMILVFGMVLALSAAAEVRLLLEGGGQAPQQFPETRLAERQQMVEQQITARGVSAEDVLNVMRAVPRHWFVPERLQRRAYADHPLPIGHGQTISQPYIVAVMTEELGVGRGDRVLEVGTGSGYQAAVLAALGVDVVSIEIIEPLAETAAERLEHRGFGSIRLLHGDGYYGDPEHAPYDAIIVTAAAGHVPPPLIEQLKPGGRMVIPVGRAGWTQNLLRVEKTGDGKTRTRNLMAVSFVPLTGDH
ncbi:MAG: protein-L-isoaspartate(D-aspartate) O-methyltransferase [Pseudomonadota bacterium]|nr:MAG: protein-L-isoaspartate(D-aspartate) O-methyltransferase [Pseudomonadota bacterium]